MSLKNFAIVLGFATAGGGGVYYAVQLEKLAGLEYEESKIRKTNDKYGSQLKEIDSELKEASALLKTLEQQADVERRSSAAVRIQLEAAKREVEGLQAELLGKEAQIKVILQNANSAQQKIKSLRGEEFRTKDKITMAERTLAQVQQRRDETKAQLNPLNHPTVKELLSRK